MVTIERKILMDLIRAEATVIDDQWEQAKLDLNDIHTAIIDSKRPNVISFYYKLKAKAASKNFNFISLDQKQINQLKKDLGEVPKTEKIFKVRSKAEMVNFSQLIIETLGYSKKRSEYYPEFYSSLGVKTCVYCNAQYALTHKRNNGVISARYELDHVDNKATYPYLCISLLNLVPICGVCNKQKPKIESLDFSLYTDKPEASIYQFEFCKKRLSKYLLCPKEYEVLDIKLKTTNKSILNLEGVFSLESLYNTQKDLAEEIIIKAKIYNATYRTMLKNSFQKLGLESKLSARVILGTYTEKKDIHRRPMTKFSQDIAIDIGFLEEL